MENIKTKFRMRIYSQQIIVIALLAYLTAGCSAIFDSTQQKLKVLPAGTQLEIYSWDGKLIKSAKSESDMTVTVDRPNANVGLGNSHLIRLQKEGYCPRYLLTKTEPTPLMILDVTIGILTLPLGIFIVGLIDNHSGGLLYAPDEFQLNIPETQQCGF
jgi:hypothetical protein